jgi:hypothetical protein
MRASLHCQVVTGFGLATRGRLQEARYRFVIAFARPSMCLRYQGHSLLFGLFQYSCLDDQVAVRDSRLTDVLATSPLFLAKLRDEPFFSETQTSRMLPASSTKQGTKKQLAITDNFETMVMLSDFCSFIGCHTLMWSLRV